MAALTAALVLPSEFKPSFYQPRSSQFVSRRRTKKTHPGFPVCVRVCVCFLWDLCIVFCCEVVGFDWIRWRGCLVRRFSKLQS